MNDSQKPQQLNEKLARALREVRRQVETGEIEGMDGDVQQQLDEALADYDAAVARAKAKPADGGPLPGHRQFEVHLPGYVDAQSSAELLLIVEAPNAASIRALVPDYSEIEPVLDVRGADAVDFVIPAHSDRLRMHAIAATANAAPADSISIQAARLARLTLSICNSPETLDADARETGRRQSHAVMEAVRKNLVDRAQIKAHHDRLNAKEQAPTGDDFNEVVDITGVKIPGSFAQLL